MTDEHDVPPFERMRDHWFWRPGWRVGRSFYTWHLTFDQAPDVHRLAADYEQALSIDGLNVIPAKWLHLTMQGIGFVDEVPAYEVDAIVKAASRRLTSIPRFSATVGPTVIDPQVVRLTVAPVEPIARIRLAIRAGIADVWGNDRVPEDEAGFVPHVSLAYSNADGPAEPITRAVESVQSAPATAPITEAQLIMLNRDHREYRWNMYATAQLGD